MENHIEQRLVDPNATVVLDKAHLAKSIHEVTNSRASDADHLRQGLLCNRRNQSLLFTWLAELRISKRILARRLSLELKS
jgi:hypothetical protein